MRAALRELVSDDWVIGLAAAIAIGYGAVMFVGSLARLVTDVAADRGHYGFSLSIAGRHVPYEATVLSAGTLAAVILLSALLLRRAKATK